MQLDIAIAQQIATLAKTLGLPVSKEDDLILALTGVDMLDASYDEAEKIWRDAQLPVEAFSFVQEEDAIAWISTDILPGVKSYINGRVQNSSIPYGYPLEDEILQKAYPDMPLQSIQVIASGWEVQRWNAIKYLTLCELFKLVDSNKEEYTRKGEEFCKMGSIYLSGLLSAIDNFIKDVPDNRTRGNFGLLVVKLPKNRRNPRNEYSEDW